MDEDFLYEGVAQKAWLSIYTRRRQSQFQILLQAEIYKWIPDLSMENAQKAPEVDNEVSDCDVSEVKIIVLIIKYKQANLQDDIRFLCVSSCTDAFCSLQCQRYPFRLTFVLFSFP